MLRDIINKICDQFHLTEEEKFELLPSDNQSSNIIVSQ
ncbi:hypothetical protein [Chitinophaga sp. CF118]